MILLPGSLLLSAVGTLLTAAGTWLMKHNAP